MQMLPIQSLNARVSHRLGRDLAPGGLSRTAMIAKRSVLAKAFTASEPVPDPCPGPDGHARSGHPLPSRRFLLPW